MQSLKEKKALGMQGVRGCWVWFDIFGGCLHRRWFLDGCGEAAPCGCQIGKPSASPGEGCLLKNLSLVYVHRERQSQK